MQHKRIYAFIGALLTWFAVITQFVLMMQNRAAPVGETVIRFFSFFTILTNTIVATYFTNQCLLHQSRIKFLDKPITAISIAVYITIVGLVYQVVLRPLWQPEGLQKLVDELLHSVIPVVYVIYWFIFQDRVATSWKWIPAGMVFPLIYLVFILIRGQAAGFYPYPFVDVGNLGLSRVLLNAAVLLMVFGAFMGLFIFVAKLNYTKAMKQPASTLQ